MEADQLEKLLANETLLMNTPFSDRSHQPIVIEYNPTSGDLEKVSFPGVMYKYTKLLYRTAAAEAKAFVDSQFTADNFASSEHKLEKLKKKLVREKTKHDDFLRTTSGRIRSCFESDRFQRVGPNLFVDTAPRQRTPDRQDVDMELTLEDEDELSAPGSPVVPDDSDSELELCEQLQKVREEFNMPKDILRILQAYEERKKSDVNVPDSHAKDLDHSEVDGTDLQPDFCAFRATNNNNENVTKENNNNNNENITKENNNNNENNKNIENNKNMENVNVTSLTKTNTSAELNASQDIQNLGAAASSPPFLNQTDKIVIPLFAITKEQLPHFRIEWIPQRIYASAVRQTDQLMTRLSFAPDGRRIRSNEQLLHKLMYDEDSKK